MKTMNRGGGFELEMFNEQRAAAVRVVEAKPSVTTTHKVAYKQIREDFQRQMGSLQRKRKSEIASENMRLYKKIQSIQTKPSVSITIWHKTKNNPRLRPFQQSVSKNMQGFLDLAPGFEEKQNGLQRRQRQNQSTTSTSMRRLGEYIGELPSKVRDEQLRIERQNAKLDAKLNSVRSNIPMNSHVRQKQGMLMDNYRKFASKYNGQKPKLDPLIAKKLKDLDDRSPGRNMQSLSNVSTTSLGLISVKYNEGSALAKKSALLKKGHFMRKSQSLHGGRNSATKRSLHQIISTKNSPQKLPSIHRNNSNDIMDVLNNPQGGLLLNEEPLVVENNENEPRSKSRNNASMIQSEPSLEPSPYEDADKLDNSSALQLDQSRIEMLSQSSSIQLHQPLVPAAPQEYSTLMAHHGRNTQSKHSLSMNAGHLRKPTITRAVDASIQQAMRSQGREQRMVQKRALIRNKDMDLTDLISRLESKAL